MPLLPSLSSAFLLSTRPEPAGSVLCMSGANFFLRMMVPVYLPVTLTSLSVAQSPEYGEWMLGFVMPAMRS